MRGARKIRINATLACGHYLRRGSPEVKVPAAGGRFTRPLTAEEEAGGVWVCRPCALAWGGQHDAEIVGVSAGGELG
jgi:hypothetical protein